MLANFRKNAGLPSCLFLAILLGIVSITFGAINASANSDDVLQTQENKTSLSQLSVAGQTANYQQAIKQPGVLSTDFNFFNIGQLKSLFESSLSGDIGSTFGGYSAANNFAASKYSPALVATLVVVNLNDSGAGSLRQAIIDAGNMPGDDAIVFQVGLSGTLTLTSGELLINSNK